MSTPEEAAASQPRPALQLSFRGSKPRVMPVLLALTVVFYLLQAASTMLTGTDLLFQLGGKVNKLISAGQLWRLFTPMLLHGSVLHLALNMYALAILGRNIETTFGSKRFLALYLVSGFTGNVLSFLLSPNPSLGSSTAIFGLLAAEAVFVYRNRKFYGARSRSILINAVSVAALNLVLGLSPGIDNWGHLGGLLGGMMFAWIGGPLWTVQGMPPVLEIVDGRSETAFLKAAGITFAVFAILAGAMIAFG